MREKKSLKPIKAKSVYKQALFLVIFIFSFIPLLSSIIDQGENDQNFSVYNDQWNGSSDFKAILEDKHYDVYNLQTELSETKRLNKSVLLILMGPNSYYNPLNEIPFFIDFFNGRNAILICHDFGSTSSLLWEIFSANMADPDVREKIPFTIFPNGILRDNKSYERNPAFPIIETFKNPLDPSPEMHPTVEGLKSVILSRASCALGGPFIDYSGWDPVGYSSFNSYVDINDDHMYKCKDDYYDIGNISKSLSDFPAIPNFLKCDNDTLHIKLGGYPQCVFMAKETDNVRIFVSADASLFNNELINQPGFDNRQFALNIVKWLTHEEDDWAIVFDEAHIRPEYSRDMTSAGIFGFYLQYVVSLSTNPLTAWIYPLLAIFTLNRYLPKKSEEKKRKKRKKKKRKKKG